MADTGLRWHLRAYDRERGRFSDFVLKRITEAQAIDQPTPTDEQIESDTQWARVVHLELVPHPGVTHPRAIEADFMMTNGVLGLEMRAPLVGYALRRWSVDCTPSHSLDPAQHHLWLRNTQTLYGVESAALHVVTVEDEFNGEKQTENLQKIAEACQGVGLQFTWVFDTTGTKHNRDIVTDHGWKIVLSRGLDVFQRFDLNDAFNFANRLQQHRQCKEFNVTFVKLNL